MSVTVSLCTLATRPQKRRHLLDFFELDAVLNGAHTDIRVQAISDLDRLGKSHQLVSNGLVDVFVNIGAFYRTANLARVVERAPEQFSVLVIETVSESRLDIR